MAAAVDTDIDAFIREQKQKLASERQALHPGDDDYLKADGYRGHWSITDGKETKFAEQETGRPRPLTPVQDIGLPVGQYKKRRQALDQQRQQDYQEYIHQKQGREGLSGDTAPRIHQDRNSSSSQHFPQDGTCEHEGIPRKAQLPIHQTLQMDFNNPTIIPFNRAEEEQERKQRMKELRNREYREVLEKLNEPNNRRVNHLNFHADHKAHPLEKCAVNKQMSREQKDGHSVHEENKNGMGDYPGGYEGLAVESHEKAQARVREECGQDYQALLASKEFRQEGRRSHRETAEEMASLPFGEHEDKRKALAAERRQDYSEMLKKDDERRQRDRLENSFGLMGLDDHQQPPPSRRRSDILPTDEHEMKRPRADSITGRRAKVDSIGDLLRWDSGASGFGRTNADMAIEALRDERRRDYLLQQEQEDRKRRQKLQQREAQRQQEQETLAFLNGSRQQKLPETELLGFQNDNRQQRQAEKETLAFPNGDRQPKWREEREHEYYQMLAGKSKEERRLEEETLPPARLGGRTSLVADLREQLREAEGRPESSTGPDVQHNFRFSREKDSVPTSSEENLFSRLGSHESERRRLQEERQREYKAMLQEKDQQRQDSINRNVLPETVREPIVRPSSALLRLRRREERNREYNMMLDEKLKQKGARNYGSIFNESYEDNFLSGLGAQDIQRK